MQCPRLAAIPGSRRATVGASLGLQPLQHVFRKVPLRFVPKVQARHPKPIELPRSHLEPIRDLLAGQNCAKRMVTPLL